MVEKKQVLKEMKEYAKVNKVPIMQEEGMNFLTNFIKEKKLTKILEVGTAIGYSTIQMALVNPKIKITSIERDEKRYLEALKNIKKLDLENQITLLFKDAQEVSLEEKYDLIFLDAAKAQNKNFFLKFSDNLEKEGYIITDNLSFHGLVQKELEEIESKNLRALVRKIKEYIEFLKENREYETSFYSLGDGISVTRKKD